jgi:hypothetical protein
LRIPNRNLGETFSSWLYHIAGANMKIAITMLFSIGMLALASGQEKPPAADGVTPAIGLDIGQPAPAFALTDQFGHEQSNQTLKGPKGTVILFFRSADW